MGYVDYRYALSPSWLLGPNGRTLSYSLGTEEDSAVNEANQGVLERFPDYAGMDSAGASQALTYIGNDRDLLPKFDDNYNLDKTRLYYKSGFSQNAAGITLPWFPNTAYVQDTLIGAGGLVWRCTTAGTSGTGSPFPTNLLSGIPLGKVIKDNTCTWTLATDTTGSAVLIGNVPSSTNPTYRVVGPPNNGQSKYVTAPNAPGFYWAGTDAGLIDALISSGFYGVDPTTGAIVPPRIYRNRDFDVVTSNNAQVSIVGAVASQIELEMICTFGGTAGAEDSGAIDIFPGSVPAWQADTVYAVGTFVHATSGYVYFASVGGTSGDDEPFSGTPSPSTWPPAPGQGVADGTVNWTYASFSPIPLMVPFGPYAMTFEGAFSPFDTANVNVSCNQPDGLAEYWARVWLVIPTSGGIVNPYRWGDSGADDEFNGQWGRGPNETVTPVSWGTTNRVSGQSLYGMIFNIVQRWLPAHDRFIGAWVSQSLNTQLDSIPAAPWEESMDVTIDGQIPAFFRYSRET